MADAPVRYRSPDEDSGRWDRFGYRSGDIVISTRSKHGTTWMQMICALLVFRTPDLPAPLAELSPWLDWLVMPLDEVLDRLEAQPHRRFVKTHTPLDGLPLDPRASYVVVARHPLDAAVSLHHQGANLDRDRLAELTGADPAPGPEQEPQPASPAPRSLHDWLVDWIGRDAAPRRELDSLPGVLRHLSDAWCRRHDPNVVLVHYDDLMADLEGQMRHLADQLGFEVPDPELPELVEAARFEQMQARADQLAPDPAGVLRDRARFFRRGRSGAGAEVLAPHELERYRTRVQQLAPPGLLTWLHRERSAGPSG
jgi:aryl sulfotransferase